MPAFSTNRFGTLLRECRKRAGSSQQQLGDYLAVSPKRVSQWETGVSDPPQDPQFYDRLRAVPGFSESDVTLLLEARDADRATEHLGKLLAHLTEVTADLPEELQPIGELLTQASPKIITASFVEGLKFLAERGLQEIARVTGEAITAPPTPVEEPPDILTEFVRTDTDKYGSILLPMPPNEVENGDRLTSHTPEQGDPSAAQGTNVTEHGREQSSLKPEQRRQAPKKDVVFQKTRSHYDREYLEEHAQNVVGLVFDAVKSNDSDLSPAGEQVLQSIHVVAESVAKRRGTSLSKASREQHIPLQSLSNYVRNELIPTLYKDSKTVYLANETVEELGRDKQDAEEMGMRLARLLRERRDKYFPQEASPSVVYDRDHTPDVQASAQRSAKTYEVVTSLQEAAKKSGVPPEEIVTIRDIAAEWSLSKSRIREWTRSGPYGQPHLTPLSVRLKGQGTGQLLFWRKDIERLVDNPPKPGRPWH